MKGIAEVAFITGAGSGIGRATAVRLARRATAVALFDIDEAGVRATCQHVCEQGGTCEYFVGDVSSDDSLAAAVEATARRFGGLDTVVASAGIATHGTVLETSVETWFRTIAVNLTGVFLTARNTIPLLIERGGGAFVAVVSSGGVSGWQRYAAYSSSKHGLVGLIRSLALDHGPQGVRSNGVCPSFVETPMMARTVTELSAEEVESYKNNVPLGRFAKPEEVAEVIAHLSSQEAALTNGLLYSLDGGETAGHFSVLTHRASRRAT